MTPNCCPWESIIVGWSNWEWMRLKPPTKRFVVQFDNKYLNNLKTKWTSWFGSAKWKWLLTWGSITIWAIGWVVIEIGGGYYLIREGLLHCGVRSLSYLFDTNSYCDQRAGWLHCKVWSATNYLVISAYPILHGAILAIIRVGGAYTMWLGQ